MDPKVQGGTPLMPAFSLKLFPTTAPMSEPMMAPATNSENQWISIETPMPT